MAKIRSYETSPFKAKVASKLKINFNDPIKYYCSHCNSSSLPLNWRFTMSGLTDQGTLEDRLDSGTDYWPCASLNGDWILTYNDSESWYRSDIDYACVWTASTEIIDPCKLNLYGAPIVAYEEIWGLYWLGRFRCWVLASSQSCGFVAYELPYGGSSGPGNPDLDMDCSTVMTFIRPDTFAGYCGQPAWPGTGTAPDFLDLEPYNFVTNEEPTT